MYTTTFHGEIWEVVGAVCLLGGSGGAVREICPGELVQEGAPHGTLGFASHSGAAPDTIGHVQGEPDQKTWH